MGKSVCPQHMLSAALTYPWVPTKTARLLLLNMNLHMASGALRSFCCWQGAVREDPQRGTGSLCATFQTLPEEVVMFPSWASEPNRKQSPPSAVGRAVLKQLEPTNPTVMCSTHVVKIPVTLNHGCLNPRLCSARSPTFQTHHFGRNDLKFGDLLDNVPLGA